MARFVVGTIFVLLPLVFSAPTEEKQGRSLGGVPVSNVAATGALGANYGQQTAASDSHDKKNFGLNFSSDRGNSNQYSNTGIQAAATGGLAQGQGIGYPSYQYQYPSYYPSVYPYPIYPNYGVPNVGLGVPNIGLGVPNIGLGVPNIGLGGVPNIGLGAPNIGLGGQNIGLGGPNVGLGVPNVGLGGQNVGLGVPNVGLGGQNVGLGAPNIGVGSGVQLPNVSAGSVAGVQGGGRY